MEQKEDKWETLEDDINNQSLNNSQAKEITEQDTKGSHVSEWEPI